jgi:hypothetical protein
VIEVFVLIGWIYGHNAGGVINQEFNSIATCEAAKTLVVEMHGIQDKENRWTYESSWVDCVKK